MNYELAKMLKDTGFPNHKCADIGDNEIICGLCSQGMNPSLSELIEACGDKFGAIYKSRDNITIEENEDKVTYENVYEAVDSTTFKMMTSPKFPKSFLVNAGSTPEEAVAYLWLQLNSQPK